MQIFKSFLSNSAIKFSLNFKEHTILKRVLYFYLVFTLNLSNTLRCKGKKRCVWRKKKPGSVSCQTVLTLLCSLILGLKVLLSVAFKGSLKKVLNLMIKTFMCRYALLGGILFLRFLKYEKRKSGFISRFVLSVCCCPDELSHPERRWSQCGTTPSGLKGIFISPSHRQLHCSHDKASVACV